MTCQTFRLRRSQTREVGNPRKLLTKQGRVNKLGLPCCPMRVWGETQSLSGQRPASVASPELHRACLEEIRPAPFGSEAAISSLHFRALTGTFRPLYMESEATHLPLWQQAWAWFEANKKQTLWGTGGLVVVALVVSIVLYRQDAADVAASEALSDLALPVMTGGSRSVTAEAYMKVANTYAGSRAGAREGKLFPAHG